MSRKAESMYHILVLQSRALTRVCVNSQIIKSFAQKRTRIFDVSYSSYQMNILHLKYAVQLQISYKHDVILRFAVMTRVC